MKYLFWLTYTNVFISLCAVALCSFCHLYLFNRFPDSSLLSFIFSATLFAYNFHRRLGRIYQKRIHKKKSITANNQGKEQWLENHQRVIDALILASFASSLFFIYYLPKQLMVIIFPLAMLSLLYILEIDRLPSLRSIPFLKIFIIAFVWGGTMVLLPVFASSGNDSIFEFETQLLAIGIALFVFGETIPFDIRDMKTDRSMNLKTIPSKFGIRASKLISVGLYFMSSLVFVYLCIAFNKPILISVSFILSILASTIFILRINEQKNELFYSLGIESSLALPLIFYLLLSYFAS